MDEMNKELRFLANSDSLNMETFLAIEKEVARIAIKKRLSPSDTRSDLWEPLGRLFTNRFIDSGDQFVHMMNFLERSLESRENYNQSNLGFEVIRIAINNKKTKIKWPAFLAAVRMYDPFLKTDVDPVYEEVQRVLHDANDTMADIDAIPLEETRKNFALPQAVPGLGKLKPTANLLTFQQLIEHMEVDVSDIENRVAILEEACKDLQVAIINLAYNIDSTASLIKYNRDVIRLDQENRGNVVTTQFVEASNPFEFPPITLPDNEFVEKDKPYKIYGKSGPILIVLDYGYGENRFLPMGTTTTIEALKDDEKPPLDIGLFLAIQHNAFIEKYFPAPRLGLNLPITGTGILDVIADEKKFFEFKVPATGDCHHEGELTVEAVVATARKYMAEFIKIIDLNDISTDRGMRGAYLYMYEHQIRRAFPIDMTAEKKVFSTGSETGNIIADFENRFLGRR